MTECTFWLKTDLLLRWAPTSSPECLASQWLGPCSCGTGSRSWDWGRSCGGGSRHRWCGPARRSNDEWVWGIIDLQFLPDHTAEVSWAASQVFCRSDTPDLGWSWSWSWHHLKGYSDLHWNNPRRWDASSLVSTYKTPSSSHFQRLEPWFDQGWTTACPWDPGVSSPSNSPRLSSYTAIHRVLMSETNVLIFLTEEREIVSPFLVPMIMASSGDT